MNTRFVMKLRSSLVRVFSSAGPLKRNLHKQPEVVAVRRSQTSGPLSSWILFQLMASNTGSVAMGAPLCAVMWTDEAGVASRRQPEEDTVGAFV